MYRKVTTTLAGEASDAILAADAAETECYCACKDPAPAPEDTAPLSKTEQYLANHYQINGQPTEAQD